MFGKSYLFISQNIVNVNWIFNPILTINITH